MYDVIFVRLMQDLSMIFWKYQLQYAYFRSRTSIYHTHFYSHNYDIFWVLNILCMTSFSLG